MRPCRWRTGRAGLNAVALPHFLPSPVSTARSSNRTGGFPASGSPTGFTDRTTLAFASPYSSFRSRRILSGGNRQHGHSPDSWPLPETHAKSGSFPPPALPGFNGTTGLSAILARPVWFSRTSGWWSNHHVRGLPVFRDLPVLYACCRPYPGESVVGFVRPPRRPWPSPRLDWVGSRITAFEACTAFTGVTACVLAESLTDPFHRRLRPARCLPGRFGCYGLERQVPGGIRTH